MNAPDRENVDKAVNLWKGFLKTQDSNPELALIFCKGALLSLKTKNGARAVS
jgi:hypothetical protein